MDRAMWLAERRAAVVADYDAIAARYDSLGYPVTLQAGFVTRLAEMVPPGGIVLDAPCGTGKYFPVVAATGRRVAGIDQSPGMLAEAAQRGIAVRLAVVGLQEMAFTADFDAAMSIDALENVPPEDWPRVLANLRRAVSPGGPLYITVEELAPELVDRFFAELVAEGAPAVRGEVVEKAEWGAFYHYYPGRERVLGWLAAEGLTVIDEAYEAGPNGEWGYRHFLARTPGG